MSHEFPQLTIVTSNERNKVDAFRRELPNWFITRKLPSFNEERIAMDAPQTEERPVYIAQEKAKEDSAWIGMYQGLVAEIEKEAEVKTLPNGDHMFLYIDTVQLVHTPEGENKVLEKPHMDAGVWARESDHAMEQSGQDVEIMNAMTAIRVSKDGVSEPKTVIVRVAATMRNFTREEIIAYAESGAAKTIEATAGGLSLANGGRKFYDMDKPLIVSVQDSLESEPEELLRYETWRDLPSEVLLPFICGAVEPAVIRLAEKTNTL